MTATDIPANTAAEITNQAPTTLEWIPANQLVTDPAYERPLSTIKVRKIVREFNPDAVGVLMTSRRSDSSNVLIDGQHRCAAFLAMEWGEQRLPCLVYHGLTLEQEAELFVVYNRDRSKPLQHDLFRAEVAAGNPAAMEIVKVLGRHGLSVTQFREQGKDTHRKAGVVSAVGALKRIHAQAGPVVLDETISVLKEAWGEEYGNQAYTNPLLQGVALVLARYSPRLVNRKRLVAKLAEITPAGLTAQARVLAQHSSTSGSHGLMTYIAIVIIGAYNKKLHEKITFNPAESTARYWTQVG